MKKILFVSLATLALSACATTEDAPADDMKAMEECAIVNNETGECACKKVDENGDCVEGGGPGVIIRTGN